MAESESQRLVGWKTIGTFCGRDARTVRRWEAERDLPVHRVPGGGSATVWADPDELREWMARSAEQIAALDAEPPAAEPEVANSRPAPRPLAWALLVASLAALIGTLLWFSGPPGTRASAASAAKPVYGQDEAANAAYNGAVYAMHRRSVAGLLDAEQAFSTLARSHPDRAAAFVGLAETNLLLREFNSLPDETAYRRAAIAAERALALDPRSVGALRSLAFVKYWSDGDSAAAFRLFDRALALEPGDSQTLHWYGTALLGEGRFEQALAMLDRAKAQEPGSSALAADIAFTRFMNGERAEAIAALNRITQIDPEFSGAHTYLARFYLTLGKDADFLRESAISARLKRDSALVSLTERADAAFRSGGRRAMLGVMIADAQRAFEQNGETALDLARYHAAAGDRAGVLEWLGRAESIRQPDIRSLIAYPDFVPYRNDPAFARYFPRS